MLIHILIVSKIKMMDNTLMSCAVNMVCKVAGAS